MHDRADHAFSAPFLDQYYVAWYFGDKGVGSTMGFAEKNLDASASTVSPVDSPTRPPFGQAAPRKQGAVCILLSARE